MPPRPLPLVALVALVFLAALGACGEGAPVEQGPEILPGLRAVPAHLAFPCVVPGCATTTTVQISVAGERRVAVKRLLVTGAAADQFSIRSSEAVPFVVGAGNGFAVDVTYTPRGAQSAESVALAITYTDAAPDESAGRIEAGELRVPLLRRVVGAARLAASPASLAFGKVPVGDSKTLAVTLTNEGFGNVALELAAVEVDHPSFGAVLPEVRLLPVGATLELPVTFTPSVAGDVGAGLVVRTTGGAEPALLLRIEGVGAAGGGSGDGPNR